MDLCHTSPRLGLDGLVSSARIMGDDCCPIHPCQLDPCALACTFVQSLPRGPLWDTAKLKAMQHLSCGQNVPCDDTECSSIVMHAVYSGHKLHMMIRDILWPVLRESNPATAYDTIDDWLDRLGWQDCFKCACDCIEQDAGETLPPYELLQPNGTTICCPDEAPDGLTLSVKRGIIIALYRLRHGIVNNLASINFVISSLGVTLTPDYAAMPDPCCNQAFKLCATSDTLPCVTPIDCPHKDADTISCGGQVPCQCHIRAWWELTCDGNGSGQRIYPGVLAAECIVRSVLPNISISRC